MQISIFETSFPIEGFFTGNLHDLFAQFMGDAQRNGEEPYNATGTCGSVYIGGLGNGLIVTAEQCAPARQPYPQP